MELIKFNDVANSLSMEESAARISIAMPPVDDYVLQYRSFCIGDMILQLLIKSGQLKKITQNHWGEILRCYTASKDKVVCLVQFNGSPQPFPLELPMRAMVGHKDLVTQTLRMLERELPVRLEAWVNVTKNGLLRMSNSQVMHTMKKYHKKAS